VGKTKVMVTGLSGKIVAVGLLLEATMRATKWREEKSSKRKIWNKIRAGHGALTRTHQRENQAIVKWSQSTSGECNGSNWVDWELDSERQWLKQARRDELNGWAKVETGGGSTGGEKNGNGEPKTLSVSRNLSPTVHQRRRNPGERPGPNQNKNRDSDLKKSQAKWVDYIVHLTPLNSFIIIF
jgi:hypothetical protein